MKCNVLIPANRLIKSVFFFLSTFFLSMYSFAQETKKIDIDVNTKSDDGNFFAQPWVWVVAGAVFILLLVALLRGNKSSS